MRLRIVTAELGCLLLPFGAQASTVLWDESADGSSAVFPWLVLQPGTNEILGTDSWVGTADDPFLEIERDWYYLELADNLTVTSVTIQKDNISVDVTEPYPDYFYLIDWTIQDAAFNFLWWEITQLGWGDTSYVFDELPIDGPQFLTLNQSASISPLGEWDISYDYRIFIDVAVDNVATVAEPGTLVLLSGALVMLGMTRRRTWG